TIAFGAISYILSDPVSQQTHRLVPAIAIDLWRLFVGAAIFVGLISVGGILFAVLSPKRKVRFSERELDKERKMIWAEQKVRKDRQKEMRKQIAKARREGK